MVRLIDHLNMTVAVDWDVKPQTKQTKSTCVTRGENFLHHAVPETILGFNPLYTNGFFLLV